MPRGALRDPVNPLLAYRLRGAVVQRSSDGGRHWATLLTPGTASRLRGGGCRPARYSGVAALRVSPLLPGALFIATSGATGPASRSRWEMGCRAATGGLFIVRPDAAGRPRVTGPFVAGLPFAQDAHGRTPRAYALRDVTPDPTNPGAAYVYAVVPGSPGPRSPWPGLFRTPDGGAHWYAATRGLPTVRIGAARGAPAGVLTINPAYGNILYDVVGATIYRSVDSGAHWAAIRAVRARHRVRLFVNPVNPSLLYALSDRGLYHSRDMGRTWLRLSGGHLPSPGRIRMLRFDPRMASAVLVVPVHGRAVRVVEPRAPAPPGFALAVTFTPLNATNVALALHAGPLAAVRIDVVDGTGDPSPTAALATNDGGFGNATIRLIEPVSPAALRVRVAAHGQAAVVTPWLSPGWTPRGVAPPPTATPTPTSTPTATETPSPTATTAPTSTPLPSPTVGLPTPYPASTLDATWAWKPLTSTLPLCSSIPVATSTPTPSPTPTSTSTPTATATPLPSPSSTASPTGGIDWPGGTSPSPTTTVTATASVSATPTATSAPAGPCNAGPPAPRFDYAAAWDNADHRLYVFGGSAGKTTLGDLAAYSTITNAWISLTPALPPVPAPRTGAAAVWDTTDNTLLLFGGAVPGGGLTDEVWSYAPASNTWTQLSANGAAGAPSARTHAAVAWDATNSRLLVFGGETPGLTNDLWSYTPSSNTWAQLSADTGDPSAPPRRSWAQIAWDSGAGVLRLFGGKSRGGGAMSDTWTWSQSGGWSFQALPDQPPGRQASAYFWDDTHGRFVVGPGPSMPGASADVWSFDSASNDWLQVPIANAAALPPRQMERMVWDAADNQALLFGGLVGANPANDLWALVPTGAAGPVPPPPPAAHPYVKSVDIGQAVSATSNAVVMHKDVPQEVAGLGATYARVSFAIGANNSAWTQARLHAYEKVIAALSAHGVQTLGLAGLGITHGWSPADWVQNARETTGESGENPAIDDYVRQLGLLVAHFSAPPYNVRRWELVNEPNVSLCPAGTPCANTPALQPSNFAYLLAAAYREIKGNPATAGVELISGGIFAHSIGGAYSRANAGATYIAHTFDEGINHSGGWTAVLHDFGSYPVDAVGVHIYVDQAQRTTPAVIRTYLDWFHAAYAAYDPSAPTSVTEIGWRTSTSEPVESVPPDVQAFNLDTACATASRLGYVDMLSWFQLRDNPSFGNGSTWGLVDRGGNAKPAYGGFKGQGG